MPAKSIFQYFTGDVHRLRLLSLAMTDPKRSPHQRRLSSSPRNLCSTMGGGFAKKFAYAPKEVEASDVLLIRAPWLISQASSGFSALRCQRPNGFIQTTIMGRPLMGASRRMSSVKRFIW